jgi:hypothetical protein
MAGFRVLYANEFIPAAQDSYRANAADYTFLDARDIRTVQPHDILEKIGLAPGELDLFDGSPPCASFSTAGKREAGWLRPGGAIIIFDKCEPASGYVATVLWRLALAGKAAAGVEAKEILAKELSLGGVQRPISPRELDPATEIFRFGDFAGWVIEK